MSPPEQDIKSTKYVEKTWSGAIEGIAEMEIHRFRKLSIRSGSHNPNKRTDNFQGLYLYDRPRNNVHNACAGTNR
jgi:hypothetical protein